MIPEYLLNIAVLLGVSGAVCVLRGADMQDFLNGKTLNQGWRKPPLPLPSWTLVPRVPSLCSTPNSISSRVDSISYQRSEEK